jgi:flagellar motor switch protein FliN/FliY
MLLRKRTAAAELNETYGGLMDISLFFTPDEIDALGEIGNIAMGNSATALNSLLGRKVTITTPTVGVYESSSILPSLNATTLAICVEFNEGLYGKNLLLIKDYDAAIITDLLMGGDGNIEQDNVVLTEIHISAIGEVMNQMIGSAATAMANMMGDSIGISPPQVVRPDSDENIARYLDGATPLVQVSFDMEIEGLLKSKLLQLMSIEMAKEQITTLMHFGEEPEPEPPKAEPPKKQQPPVTPSQRPAQPAAPAYRAPEPDYSPWAERSQPSSKMIAEEKQQVRAVKSATFESFDEQEDYLGQSDMPMSNFDLINDIPLQVMVELGRTKKSLGEVLNLGIGSIIVLDKQAGELVDVIVNGKRIAKGEVVVVDENYGVRITELIKG